MTMSQDPKIPRWQPTVQEPPRHGIGFEHPDAKELSVDITTHQVIVYSKRTGAKISISRSSKPGEYYVMYELKWPNIGSSTGERYFTEEMLRRAFNIAGSDSPQDDVEGRFSRRYDHLTIPPCKTEVVDGTPSMSIHLTSKIITTVQTFLEARVEVPDPIS